MSRGRHERTGAWPLPVILRRAMRRHAFIVAAVAATAALSLAACSGGTATGLDQMVYNAAYSGPGTFQRSPIEAGAPASSSRAVRVTISTSQLGQDFSGTFSIADSTGLTLYTGGITGRTTSAGGDFTFVIPPPCVGAMYGSFGVVNGALTGSAAGRDCDASATGNNVQITFTNLVAR